MTTSKTIAISARWLLGVLLFSMTVAVCKADKVPSCAFHHNKNPQASVYCHCSCTEQIQTPNGFQDATCFFKKPRWNADGLTLYEYDGGQLKELKVDNGFVIVPISDAYDIPLFFLDLLSPPFEKVSGGLNPQEYQPICDDVNPFGTICQSRKTQIRLGKQADVYGGGMKTKLYSAFIETDSKFWGNVIDSGWQQYAFLSNDTSDPRWQCLSIPQGQFGPGKRHIARWFKGGLPQDDDNVDYLKVYLAYDYQYDLLVHDVNVQDKKLVKGLGGTAKFKASNRGTHWAKAIFRLVASTQKNVLGDPDRVPFSGWYGMGDHGSVIALDQASLTASIDANLDDFVKLKPTKNYSGWEINVDTPENISGFPGGQLTDVYFTFETVAVETQDDAGQHYPPTKPQKDGVPVAPLVTFVDVSLQDSGASPNMLSIGSTLNFDVTVQNERVIPSANPTIQFRIVGNGVDKKIGEFAGLPAVNGNSEQQYSLALTLVNNPGNKLKAGKEYKIKVIIKDFVSNQNKSKVAADKFDVVYQGSDPPTGFGYDHNGDGVLDDSDTGTRLLIPINDNDTDQNSVPDYFDSFNVADPEKATLTVVWEDCSASEYYYLDYAHGEAGHYSSGRIKVYNTAGVEILPLEPLSCSGTSDPQIFYVEGTQVSAQTDDVPIKLYLMNFGAANPAVDDLHDELDVTVFKIQLNSDSNNDGQYTADDEICGDNPYAIPMLLSFNSDDDDGNGTPDYLDEGPVVSETELKPVGIQLLPADMPVVLAADGANVELVLDIDQSVEDPTLRLWTTSTKNSPVDVPNTYEMTDVTFGELVYVEGVAWSADTTSITCAVRSNGKMLYQDDLRCFTGQLSIGFIGEVSAGDKPLVAVTGLPPSQDVLFEVLDGMGQPSVHNPPKTVTVDEFGLGAAMEVEVGNIPGEQYMVRATISDDSCTHILLESEWCTVAPAEPFEMDVTTHEQTCQLADGSYLYAFDVRVVDEFDNIVPDGTPVVATLDHSIGGEIIGSGLQSTFEGYAYFTVKVPNVSNEVFEVYFRSGVAEFHQGLCLTDTYLNLEPTAGHETSVASQLQVTANAIANDGARVDWTIVYGDGTTEHKQCLISDFECHITLQNVPAGRCDIVAKLTENRIATTHILFTDDSPFVEVGNRLIAGDQIGSGTQLFSETLHPEYGQTQSYSVDYQASASLKLYAEPNTTYTVELQDLEDADLVTLQYGLAQSDESIPITTDSEGVTHFEILSDGNFTPDDPSYEQYFDLFNHQMTTGGLSFYTHWGNKSIFYRVRLNGDPVYSGYVAVTTTFCYGVITDALKGVFGFDTNTPEGAVGTLAGGFFLTSDIGEVIKNTYRAAGFSNQDVDYLNFNLSMLSLGMIITPGPDGSFVSALRALISFLKNQGAAAQDFVKALARVVWDAFGKQTGVYQGQSISELLEIGRLADNMLRNPEYYHSIIDAVGDSTAVLQAAIRNEAAFGADYVVAFGKLLGDFDPKTRQVCLKFMDSLTPEAKVAVKQAFNESGAADDFLASLADLVTTKMNLGQLKQVMEASDLFSDSWGRVECMRNLAYISLSGTKAPYNHLLEGLLKQPDGLGRYRVLATAQLLLDIDVGDPIVSFTAQRGRFVRAKFAEDVHAAHEAPVHSALSGRVPDTVIEDIRYVLKKTPEDWGKATAEAVMREHLAKFSTVDGKLAVRFVVPNIDEVPEIVARRIEEWAANGMDIQLVQIPDLP